ncbi:MAG: CPBP family intramembrane glutamic endopeptidase [Nitrospira sp.]|nr:CPBP family intramembrane metalloprotease [Nitrospira sp.]
MDADDSTGSTAQMAAPPLLCVGAPPPPHAYDPGFSRAITLLSAIILSASIAVVAWLSFDVPRVERVPDAERALSHMVGRLMDQAEGLKTLPVWEQFLYEATMGSDTNDREQAIEWYRELAEESSDPFVDLHLAILEGEAGQLQVVQQKVSRWSRQSAPYLVFAGLLQAGYLEAHVSPAAGFDLQAHLAELPVTGWFYSRLAARIAERTGERPLLLTIEMSSQQRVETLLWRSRAFALLELTLMIVGLLVLVLWMRRGKGAATFRVGSAELPPLWAGRLGAGVLLRGGAVGALLTVAFLYAAGDYPSLRAVAVPLSNLPLLALAYYHLLRPQRQTFWRGFGLRIEPRRAGRLGLAVLAVVAAGLVGEWLLGRIAEPLNLISHWTEWFDADLVWGTSSTLVVSLMEYVLFAPIFEELAFRGLLFGILRRRFQWGAAAMLSAALFALAHGYGLIGFLSVFWSGLIWAWAYERTGSLWPGMIGHAVNNLLVCLSVMALLRA